MRTEPVSLDAPTRQPYWGLPMNRITRRFSILVAPLGFAHDPAEHANVAAAKNAAPDCAAMKEMDHSKMDANDPVMKAMMAKCGSADGRAGADHGKTGSAPAKPDAYRGH